MQVKRKDIITYLSERLNYKNCDNIKCEGVEKLSHSYIDDGNVNSPSMLENVFWEIGHLTTTWVTITLPGIYAGKMKTQLHRLLCS